jgi:hypothetical protein
LRRLSLLPLVVVGVVLATLLWMLLAVLLTLRPAPSRQSALAAQRARRTAVAATRTVTAGQAAPARTPTRARSTTTTTLTPTSLATGEAVASPDAASAASTVPPAPSPTVTATIPITLPGRFDAADYKGGGEGVGYHDWTQGNEGGAYRSDDVDVERCTDGEPCYAVAFVMADEWLAYDVRVARADMYSFTVRVAAPRSDARLHIELDGANITGPIAVPQTGSYSKWANVSSEPVSIAAGPHELRLVAETDGFNVRSVVVAVGAAVPTPRATASPTRRRAPAPPIRRTPIPAARATPVPRQRR